MLWPEQYETLRAALPARASEATDVYEFYDAAGSLLYVGISLSLLTRIKQHRNDKPWWREVSRIEVRHCPSRQDALFVEFCTIQTKRPRYNVQGQAHEPMRYPDAALFVAAVHRLQSVGDWADMEWPTDDEAVARMDATMDFLEGFAASAEAYMQGLAASGRD